MAGKIPFFRRDEAGLLHQVQDEQVEALKATHEHHQVALVIEVMGEEKAPADGDH